MGVERQGLCYKRTLYRLDERERPAIRLATSGVSEREDNGEGGEREDNGEGGWVCGGGGSQPEYRVAGDLGCLYRVRVRVYV